ncbi:MAG: hypothetical protein ACRDA4_08545 [Filifactoraceae bacterium]
MRSDEIIEVFSRSLEKVDVPSEAKTKISLEFLRKLTEVNSGGNNRAVRKSKKRK